MGKRAPDLMGKKFGDLVVVARAENDRWNNARWLCQCACGNKTVVVAHRLGRRRSPTRSCGCLRRKIIDLTGQRFGRLLAQDFEMRNVPDKKWSNKQRAYWRCLCDCGKVIYVTATNLRKGNTSSCGCSRILPNDGAARHAIAYKYRQAALARGQDMELDNETLAQLVSQPCHYCGTGPSNVHRHHGGGKPFFYNGLDRKSNDVGYTANNVVPCCRQCNFAKGSMNYREFLDWIDRIIAHRSNLS